MLLLLDPSPDRPQPLGHRREAVGFLEAKLAEAAHSAGPLGEGGGDEQDWIFIDRPGRHFGRDVDCAQRRVADAEVGDPLAPGLAQVRDRDVAAHLAQKLEQAGTRRVHPDALDRQFGAGNDEGRDDEKGRCGRVAGDGQRLRPELRLAAKSDLPAVDGDVGAEQSEHKLAMIAGRPVRRSG